MQHPIGYCSVHGFFRSEAVAIAPGANVIVGASVVTTCPAPNCRQTAEMLPGHYESTLENKLNFLVDPSISSEGLLKLREIAEALQRNDITAQEAKRQAATVAPKAVGLFDIGNWSERSKKELLIAIIAAAAVLAKCDGPPTINVINNIQVLERVQSRPDAPTLPGLPGGGPLLRKV